MEPCRGTRLGLDFLTSAGIAQSEDLINSLQPSFSRGNQYIICHIGIQIIAKIDLYNLALATAKVVEKALFVSLSNLFLLLLQHRWALRAVAIYD
jgi:hypothetical protein